MPPQGRVTALVVALLVVATTAAPQNASMSANTGTGSQSDDGKTLTADGRAGIIVGVTMGVFGFVGYVLYERRKSVWRTWYTKMFKRPAGTPTPEDMVIPLPPAAPMPNTPGYEIPSILNYERPSTNGYFLYHKETTQGYELTPQISKPDSSSLVVADAPPTIPSVTTTSSAATTTGLSSNAFADASPVPPALTPGSSSSATADTPPARPPAVTGSATSTTGTSSSVSADTPPAPPPMIAGSTVGATGFSSSATADAPPAAPAVAAPAVTATGTTGTTGTSSSMPADALSTAAAVTTASSSLVLTDARPAASTMTSTEDYAAPAKGMPIVSSKVSAGTPPAAPATDSLPAPQQLATAATPPPTIIQQPDFLNAPSGNIPGLYLPPGYSNLFILREKWLSRARDRRDKRRVTEDPLVKHGLRWELVEANEDLPNDALSFENASDYFPLHVARAVGWDKDVGRPEMIVNGLYIHEERGVESRSDEDFAASITEPPYEVLCGPEGAVELYEIKIDKYRAIYCPTLLIPGDNFDDFPISRTIEEKWNSSGRNMTAVVTNDMRIARSYYHLRHKDGFMVRDPGLLLLADHPSVQGIPEGVTKKISYKVDRKNVSFWYQA